MGMSLTFSQISASLIQYSPRSGDEPSYVLLLYRQYLYSPRSGDEPQAYTDASQLAQYSPRSGDEPVQPRLIDLEAPYSPRSGDEPLTTILHHGAPRTPHVVGMSRSSGFRDGSADQYSPRSGDEPSYKEKRKVNHSYSPRSGDEPCPGRVLTTTGGVLPT